MKYVSLVLTICLTVSSAQLISAQQDSCSAQPGKLPPCPAIPPPTQELPDHKFGTIGDVVIDESMAQQALDVLALFEASDPKRPWRSVGPLTRISLGFLQWNAGTCTLFQQLFPEISKNDIDLAAPTIRKDLRAFKDYSEQIANEKTCPNDITPKKQAVDVVIKSWKTAKPNDPLVKKIRKSIRAKVGDWLDTAQLRAAQRRAIDAYYLKSAIFYAQLWHQDSGSQKPYDARLLTYFLDMQVFNGDPKGAWLEHVLCFRRKYPGVQAIEAISRWTLSCKDFPKKLSRIDDALASANYWLKHENEMDNDQIDLLVLGFLVSLKSTGAEDGIEGFFQADVATRRGIIASGGFLAGKEVKDVMNLQ